MLSLQEAVCEEGGGSHMRGGRAQSEGGGRGCREDPDGEGWVVGEGEEGKGEARKG